MTETFNPVGQSGTWETCRFEKVAWWQLRVLSDFIAGDGLQWAQQHLDPLYWAFAKTLNVHPAELRALTAPGHGLIIDMLKFGS